MAKIYSVPKNVFLHLLMTAMLYTSVVSLIVLLTAYINVLLPDDLYYFTNHFDTIRFSSSTLFVAFAVFILSNWLIARDVKKHKEIKESKVRKWLVYLTLFVAAITIVCYLVALIYNFYGGDLSLPFFLKVVVVLVITAAVFAYYLADLHGHIKNGRMMAWIVSVVVLACLVTGFFVVGSPMEQRKVRLDQQRVSSLMSLDWEVTNYWQHKGVLPQSLDELDASMSGYNVMVDPVTGTQFEYEVLGEMSFRLCANFEASNRDLRDRGAMDYSYIDPNKDWLHDAGRSCFDRTIDPAFYPLING